MCKTSFLSSLFILTTLCAGVVAAPIKPASKATKPAAQKSPWTHAQILQYTKEIIPVVEQVTGRKFKVVPKIRVATSKELARVMAQEMMQRYESTYPERSASERKSQAEYAASIYTVHFWGVYSPHFNAVFLMPTTIAPSLAKMKVDKKLYDPIMRCIIAHELSHALQNQEVRLVNTMYYSGDPGKSAVGHMLVEGFAEFTSSKVVEAMGVGEAYSEMYHLFTKDWTAELGKDACIHSILNTKEYQEQFVEQFDFFSWQYAHGGYEKVWDVIAHPPVCSRMFYLPATYSPTAFAGPDYQVALKGIEKRFGDRKWKLDRYTSSMPSFVSTATEIVPKDAQKTISSYVTDAGVDATYKNSAVDVKLYVADSPEGAMLLAKYTRDWFLKFYEPHPKDKWVKVIGRENIEMKDDRFVFAAKQRIDTDEYMDNRNSHYEMVRGNLVVRVHTSGWKLSDKQVLDIGDEVLKKVEEMH